MRFPIRIAKQPLARHHTDPSFTEGVARLVDFGALIDVSRPPPPVKSETEGLRDIWLAVGRDFQWASGRYMANSVTGTRREPPQ